MLGSSPLTRGKPLREIAGRTRHGLIPAHAGKTTRPTQPPSRPEAHPRSRGENGVVSSPFAVFEGSSPLTRGKRPQTDDWCNTSRLIPAHAGKTKKSDHTDPGPSAHPRSRGENDDEAREEGVCAGSSPLTRGKLPRLATKRKAERLIPAHAGKTKVRGSVFHVGAAHPRSRGENRLVYWPTRTVMGSSPLTRGKRYRGCRRFRVWRLIPAHAGKTARQRDS